MAMRLRFAGLALAAVLLLHPILAGSAQAQQREPGAFNQFAAGLGSLLVTPVYGSFKLATAFAGVIVGSLTWVFTGGDIDTAQKVWDPTMKGTYVISPEHLRGEKPIVFLAQP